MSNSPLIDNKRILKCFSFHNKHSIWEKKYGKDAKHLQNQNEKGNVRSSLHGTHGQVQGRGRGGPGSTFPRNDASKVTRGGKEGPKVRNRVANLHPSWEAKRKAKQRELAQMSAAASGAQHMGKKIKFD